ncbi:hypothetical protein niasHS_003066 [Heterodera schachtii]|uniref:Transmembrane protein n=1 Tax=Heterodera schachtii TaxID=97005 RepID=A0ABD2K9R6_HETSC
MSFVLSLFAVFCLGLHSTALQCKVGHYSNYGAIIEVLECPPIKTEFCIAYGCQKEPNDVYMGWQCSESDKCPDLSGANDFAGLNLTACKCKIGEKGANLGNENFTFPIDDPAGSDQDGAYHNSMDSPDKSSANAIFPLLTQAFVFAVVFIGFIFAK